MRKSADEVEALKESREQLIAIVQDWSFARSFESFFDDVQQRVSTLPPEQRDSILGRIAQARAMLVVQTPTQKWNSIIHVTSSTPRRGVQDEFTPGGCRESRLCYGLRITPSP